MLFQSLSGIRTVPEFLVHLEEFGLLDAMLPFILIFAVVFSALKMSKVLGENKGVHALIALVLALLVVVPHLLGTYPDGQDVVEIINHALPNVSLFIVVIVAALILVGLITPETHKLPGAGFFAILAVGIVVYIFGLSAGWWETAGVLGFLSNPDIQAVLVIVLVFVLVIFMITSDEPFKPLKSLMGAFKG